MGRQCVLALGFSGGLAAAARPLAWGKRQRTGGRQAKYQAQRQGQMQSLNEVGWNSFTNSAWHGLLLILTRFAVKPLNICGLKIMHGPLQTSIEFLLFLSS
jgi:hypothetical protein